ncbi:hypothetical protein [Xanthobacter flavus]|uniref:hypothetical protein n=1 Tax=Xanthobacter flavus TaxID=281 RepID=UPI0037272A9E
MDLFSPTARGRAVPTLRAALFLALAASLSACAGSGIPGLAPPQTSVPEVDATHFPTLGGPQPDRREPLTTEQQQKLQRDLERLARQQQAKQVPQAQ